jgi:hypothetical protein
MTDCKHKISEITETSKDKDGIELFVKCGECQKEGSVHLDFSDLDNTNPWWEN